MFVDHFKLGFNVGFTNTKVQEKDQDGSIRTFLELDCTPPGWAGQKAEFIYEVTVAGRPKPFRIKSGDEAARFRVNKTGVLHTVRVRARSGVGQNSAWTSSIGITPSKKGADASAITGVAISRKNGNNNITWDRISDPDNREVAIMAGTSNVLASMTEIGRTKSTKWTDSRNIVKGTRMYYRVLPVDTSDNVGSAVPSAAVDDVETGIGTSDTDRTTLAAPTGITLTQANRDVDKDGTVDIALLTTFSGGVAGATGYEVEWIDSAGQTASARADTGKFWFKANTIRSYQARWRAYDWTNAPGNWSSYSGSVTPAATTGAPANPTNVVATPTEGGFGISWDQPPAFDYAYSEIAIRGSAGTPTLSEIAMTTSARNVTVYHPWYNYDVYLYVRHFNSSGLSSSWAYVGSPKRALALINIDGGGFGTSGGSVTIPSSAGTAILVASWRCTSNTAGITVTIGSAAIPCDFIDGALMSYAVIEYSGGIKNISKTGGGTWNNVRLSYVASYDT